MATYFVANGGSGSAPTTWAGAYGSLATALAAATTDGDIVVIQHDSVPTTDSALSADTTYTAAANIFIISASNDGGSNYTPTPMSGTWIGHSSLNRSISISAVDKSIYVYGLYLLIAGNSTDSITLGSGTGGSYYYDNCTFDLINTNSGSNINFCNNTAGFINIENSIFKFGHSSQNFVIGNGTVNIINSTISNGGSSPSDLINSLSGNNGAVNFIGCDLSYVTGTLVDNISTPYTITFDRCKLGAGVIPLAAQTGNPTLASPTVWISDCSSGDTHGIMGYYNALGNVSTSTGVKLTNNASGISWIISTTSLASRLQPFYTPYVDMYHDGTSAITPYFEVLLDGSSTAFKDHEIWAEFTAKTTSGTTAASYYSDRASMLNYATANGSNQATGAGAGGWTGESGTIWSGKCDSGSSFTPAEAGFIRGRIGFSVPSSYFVYVNPEILI